MNAYEKACLDYTGAVTAFNKARAKYIVEAVSDAERATAEYTIASDLLHAANKVFDEAYKKAHKKS